MVKSLSWLIPTLISFIGKGMQQTFWLNGRSVYDTVQPKVVERRNAICPQLYEAPDLGQLSPQNYDEDDDVFEVHDSYIHYHIFSYLNTIPR